MNNTTISKALHEYYKLDKHLDSLARDFHSLLWDIEDYDRDDYEGPAISLNELWQELIDTHEQFQHDSEAMGLFVHALGLDRHPAEQGRINKRYQSVCDTYATATREEAK